MKKYKENEELKEQFQREQRGRATAGSRKAAEAGPNLTITQEEGAEPAPVGEGGAGAASFSDMFGSSGHADLAIARKMEKKDE
jgi:hypothetical protein